MFPIVTISAWSRSVMWRMVIVVSTLSFALPDDSTGWVW